MIDSEIPLVYGPQRAFQFIFGLKHRTMELFSLEFDHSRIGINRLKSTEHLLKSTETRSEKSSGG